MGIYDDLDKQNKKNASKGGGIFADLDKQIAKDNAPAKKPLLQRAGNFAKGMVVDGVRTFARVGSTLIDPLEQKITGKPTNKDFGTYGEIRGLGQIPGQTRNEQVKDVVGGLSKAASWYVGGKGTGGVFGKASKGKILGAGAEGTVAAAGGGFLDSFGNSLQEGNSYGKSLKKGVVGGAIAAPFGFLAGIGSGYLGSKLSRKVPGSITDDITNNIDETIPPTTPPPPPGSSSATKGNRLEVKEAFDVADKLGFNMRKSVQILEEAGKKSGNDGYYSIADIEDIAKKYTPDKTSTVVKPTNVPEPIIKGRVTAPKIDPQTGIPMTSKTPTNKATTKPNTTTPSKVISNVAPEQAQQIVPEQPSQFKPGTREFYNETITKDFEVDPKRVEDIALGFRTDTTSNVPTDAYLAFLKNKADETLDLDLIEKLKKSKVSSVSGQKLESNKLAREGNIVDITKEVEDALLKKRGISKNSIDKEAQDIANKISEVFDSLKNQTVTKNIVVDALEAIKCK